MVRITLAGAGYVVTEAADGAEALRYLVAADAPEPSVIVLDVQARRLDLDVPAAELQRRTPSPAMTAGFASPRRGWERLYVEHVQQADTGADLDFLTGSSGANVSRDSH